MNIAWTVEWYLLNQRTLRKLRGNYICSTWNVVGIQREKNRTSYQWVEKILETSYESLKICRKDVKEEKKYLAGVKEQKKNWYASHSNSWENLLRSWRLEDTAKGHETQKYTSIFLREERGDGKHSMTTWVRSTLSHWWNPYFAKTIFQMDSALMSVVFMGRCHTRSTIKTAYIGSLVITNKSLKI